MATATVDYRSFSIPDRLALVHDIWDSLAEQPTEIPLSESQRLEFERRLAGEDDSDSDQVVAWELVKVEAIARIKI